MLSSAITGAAKTAFVPEMNVVDGIATIDGVMSPGEWDDCAEMKLALKDVMEDTGSGDGSGVVSNVSAVAEEIVPAAHTNDDITVSVRFKEKDGYLYMLETRKDKTLLFTRDDADAPYASDGSIVFFVKDGVQLADIFIMARTKSNPAPMFAKRLNGTEMGELNAVEAISTVTADSFVLEAKFKLSDLALDENEFKTGKYGVTYCAVNVYNPAFDGETSGLWNDNAYQLQYKGVGPWGESPMIKMVTGGEWPLPEAVAEPETTEAEAAPAATETSPAPKTADMAAPFALIALAAVFGAALVFKKRAVK